MDALAVLLSAAEFPYDRTGRRERATRLGDPEFELLDTGIFDEDRYWDITVDYAKADTDDIVVRVHDPQRRSRCGDIACAADPVVSQHVVVGLRRSTTEHHRRRHALVATHHIVRRNAADGDGEPQLLFCDNETNDERLWGTDGAEFPKDAINDHVVDGRDTLNPAQIGTKAAMWYQFEVASGETDEIGIRLHRDEPRRPPAQPTCWRPASAEADEFYAA